MDSSNFASVKQEKIQSIMKIKNILALLCFLCIGVSCSMEDDILSGVDTKGSEANISDTEAVFILSLSGNSSRTEAVETEDPNVATSTEVTIRNCFVAIIKDGNEVCLLIGTKQAIYRLLLTTQRILHGI